MIAVTIGVGSYAAMARDAAALLRRQTGLETIVVGDEQFAAAKLAKPHHLKFRLFDLVEADQILYFDADLVCLNPWDPRALADPDRIVAIPDRNTATVRAEAILGARARFVGRKYLPRKRRVWRKFDGWFVSPRSPRRQHCGDIRDR